MTADGLTDASGPETLEEWTSLAHISLVLALEAEYGITLSPEEALEMSSVAQVRSVLAAHGVTAD